MSKQRKPGERTTLSHNLMVYYSDLDANVEWLEQRRGRLIGELADTFVELRATETLRSQVETALDKGKLKDLRATYAACKAHTTQDQPGVDTAALKPTQPDERAPGACLRAKIGPSLLTLPPEPPDDDLPF